MLVAVAAYVNQGQAVRWQVVPQSCQVRDGWPGARIHRVGEIDDEGAWRSVWFATTTRRSSGGIGLSRVFPVAKRARDD